MASSYIEDQDMITFHWVTGWGSGAVVTSSEHSFGGIQWKVQFSVTGTVALFNEQRMEVTGFEAVVCLIDNKGCPVGETTLRDEDRYSTSSVRGWARVEFMRKEDIQTPSRGLLMNGNITFRVTIYKGSVPRPEEEGPDIGRDLRHLLDNERFSDLMVKVEGQQIPAFSGILVSRSPVFRAMLEPHTKEWKERVIEIEGFSPQTVQAMVSFMYTDHVEPDTCSLELLNAAEMYDLKKLKVTCERLMISTLTSDNVLDILEKSRHFKALILRNACCDFMAKNLSLIKMTDV
jgi:speckle-type POZ protein